MFNPVAEWEYIEDRCEADYYSGVVGLIRSIFTPYERRPMPEWYPTATPQMKSALVYHLWGHIKILPAPWLSELRAQLR
jgi:hypothetical protein